MMVKRFIISLLSILMLISCQESVIPLQDEVGYLRLELSTVSSLDTKSVVPENYNPKQLKVEIKNAEGVVVKSTNNFDAEWKDKDIAIAPGSYTITASSFGFDGKASGERIPYYTGSTTVEVAKDLKPVSASIKCQLANVKVTFRFDKSVLNVFKSLAIEVSSSVPDIASQFASSSITERVVYFPVGDLTVKTSVTNMVGTTFPALEKKITGVKARNHYILHCKLSDSGNGNITVEADDTEKEYTYTFTVPTKSSTQLEAKIPNVIWSKFVELEGSILSKTESFVPDVNFMKFEWKKNGELNWKTLASTFEAETYKATLKGLEPNTKYVYRLSYKKDSEEYTSGEVAFTTEAVPELPYGNMDTWVKNGKTWYLGEAKKFWDSSNPGTTTGAGVLVNANPTQGSDKEAHTPGGKSAELKSQYASALGIGKFAAASLYAGEFNSLVGANGAKIDFGREFTSRPTQLKGWFKYSTGKMDYVGEGLPEGTNIQQGKTDDLWSAYVVLTNNSYQLDNTNMKETSKDFDYILKNGKDQKGFDVIAYGALPDAECIPSVDWKQFTIDLTYRNLVEKPTHIIIVFSSSKYGDYFTGSTSSLLYLDDLEFVYGDTPTVLNN